MEKEAGRPTKFKEEYIDQVYKLCLLGATDSDLADFFEVTETTINNWKIDFPLFFESLKKGKKIADIEVADSLYKGAIDRIVPKQQAIKVKDIKYNEQGRKISEEERIEVVELDEYITGDFRNQQFWLRNRDSSKWRDKQEIDQKTEMSGSLETKTTIKFTKGSK